MLRLKFVSVIKDFKPQSDIDFAQTEIVNSLAVFMKLFSKGVP